jgi:hypothetical protein
MNIEIRIKLRHSDKTQDVSKYSNQTEREKLRVGAYSIGLAAHSSPVTPFQQILRALKIVDFSHTT